MRFNEGRTFGVEIEFVGVRPMAVAAALVRNGLRAEAQGYNHNTQMVWKVISDASCGFELVSPPLAGQAGLDQVKVACQTLIGLGATVTGSCGLHVHHQVRDLPAVTVARFLKFYARYEGVIDMLVAPSRRNNNNHYCKSLYYLVSGDDDFARLDQLAARSMAYEFTNDRYYKVNMTSFERHGTVEIRQHQGTLDYEKVTAWIVFTQAMLNHCVDSGVNNRVKSPTYEALKVIMGAVSTSFRDDASRTAMKFLDRRFHQFAKPNNVTTKTKIFPGRAPMAPAARTPRRAARRGEQ